LLGISMVATTFSADTPNLVTDIVRRDGVAGNWAWWSFLLTGMLTVFVYARLWRKLGTLTDLEFYELRYGGKAAAFLRGFRALYLGVFFNVVIMATVCVAGIKLFGILLGLSHLQTLLIAGSVALIYSTVGGLKSVLFTDLIQFIVAMAGSVAATIYIMNMPEVGGLTRLLSLPEVSAKTSLLPDFQKPEEWIPLLLVPLAVQWWSVWYPGAEPGGGGYIAQRMLAAKNEKHALGATLFFNAAHYALRPWPWILVALASLAVFPQLTDIGAAFPEIPADKVKDDLAYPAMLSFLPTGLKGLVVASLVAALLSTLSTHLNWGSGYVVNDFYKRFIRPEASDRQLVGVGRVTTVLLMLAAAGLAFWIDSAREGFQLLLQIGAGTGLIFILRWFWSRINAWSEISGMIVSFLVATGLLILNKTNAIELPGHWEMVLGVGITTAGWLIVTFLTKPEPEAVWLNFRKTISFESGKPGVTLDSQIKVQSSKGFSFPMAIVAMVLGTVAVWSALFATGHFIYGNISLGLVLTASCVTAAFLIFRLRKSIGF
jgi:solute:Na+ symporter, SSS family